ncbi:DNA methyltransferase [Lysinibacillus telephonicus]|uniref:DNA methylase n=1 Tax=Lysinibacillus telephonicus TaxID=1714840 RepID=A0A3S0HI24_9BACI|nr:DNA methyltransferase [Lysinibacillus telephonicus]RTQ92251.1 DNA methylase [Lysinibacillus telephonicus]
MTKNSEQLSLINKSEADNTPVVCLGITFENDEARREYFREELRKKLPELRQIEGFPVGEDEDIIAISDPPYYTACPNPWVNEFIEEWEKHKSVIETNNYFREPFVADVSEGKTDPIYLAHSYHTKVPHKAIMRYLLHYTQPGDIILDGFSGTGMTGVASSLCNDTKTLESMGFEVNGNIVKDPINNEQYSRGHRNTILNDLSPIAAFVSQNYVNPSHAESFSKEAIQLMEKVKAECGWMFKTQHINDGEIQYDSNGEVIFGDVNYTVYSDVFECSSCMNEIIFTEVAFNLETGSVLKEFNCNHCGAKLTKNGLSRVKETIIDAEGEKVVLSKQIPYLINYNIGKNNYTKKIDSYDISLLKRIEETEIPYWYPKEHLPDGVNINQPKISHGLTKVHHFYSKRALLTLAKTFDLLHKMQSKNRHYLHFAFEQAILGMSKIARYVPTHYSQVNQYLSGTLYIGSQIVDVSLEYILNNKIKRLTKLLGSFESNFERTNLVSTQAIQSLKTIMPNSIDYIFTDPPFGANLMYSDLNLLWESWLKVKTNIDKETIVNPVQEKDIDNYKTLMQEAFEVYYKVLKPNRWITVEFSNSKASVWNAIQESMQKSGFVIANVAALDKKQGSFKAVTSTTAVKQDLVISAYKPSEENIQKMREQTNTQESAWTFVNQHLEKLPVFLGTKGEASMIAERMPRILFDRMIAYHVQNGLPVPISSAEFQEGVAQRFPMRDGMAFLESQVAEYDKKRILVKEFTQMNLFVSDETSAIEWIRQQLMKKPQTRQDLHPQFMKEIQHIAKHEKLPELDDLLTQNFLRYEGDESVPDQIVSYLHRNYKDLRGLTKDDEKLKEKAMNRWYVPDPNKQADLEKLREKTLLREFESYLEELGTHKKKLKQFRTEAIRAGFKKAWGEKDYQKIVYVGDRLPESVIQEDDKLLMYYDNAQVRVEM